MLVLATLVFGLSFFSYGLALVPFLLILFLFGITLGIFGSAVVLRFGPASEWFVWPIPALVSPFAGVFYPLSTLPQWMQLFAKLLPPAYVFEDLRTIVLAEPPRAPRCCGAAVWSSSTCSSPAGFSSASILMPCARGSSPGTARKR